VNPSAGEEPADFGLSGALTSDLDERIIRCPPRFITSKNRLHLIRIENDSIRVLVLERLAFLGAIVDSIRLDCIGVLEERRILDHQVNSTSKIECF